MYNTDSYSEDDKSNLNKNNQGLIYINKKTDQNENITDVDEFIKYINKNIKKANKYYSNNDPDIIEKYNNYLYFFAKSSIKCMEKN